MGLRCRSCLYKLRSVGLQTDAYGRCDAVHRITMRCDSGLYEMASLIGYGQCDAVRMVRCGDAVLLCTNKISRFTNRSPWCDAMRCVWSDAALLCTNKISRFTNRSIWSDAMRLIWRDALCWFFWDAMISCNNFARGLHMIVATRDQTIIDHQAPTPLLHCTPPTGQRGSSLCARVSGMVCVVSRAEVNTAEQLSAWRLCRPRVCSAGSGAAGFRWVAYAQTRRTVDWACMRKPLLPICCSRRADHRCGCRAGAGVHRRDVRRMAGVGGEGDARRLRHLACDHQASRMFVVFCKPILAMLLRRKHQTIIKHLPSPCVETTFARNSHAGLGKDLTTFHAY